MKIVTPTSPDGSSIDVSPIRRGDLGNVLIRCLPDGYRIEMLFKTQEIIGFSAWDGENCIAQLHCYRLILPHGSADLWPAWSRPSYVDGVLNGCLGISGPVWCHACFHVGRSIESFTNSDEPDSRYFGRGIGTALAQASVRWANEHDYKAVIAPGAPDGLYSFSVFAGGLPWTTYQKLGFTDETFETNDDLPEWAKGNAPSEVVKEVEAALGAGRPKKELHSKLMMLRLKKST
jgi:GNAT superfamily N-acetyltransferase